jgi:hypothetical protein
MMEEFVFQFSKFNSLVNPSNEAIYYFSNYSKDYSNKGLTREDANKIVSKHTFSEILELLASNPGRNVHVDLCRTGLMYIDSDSFKATEIIKEFLDSRGLKYIQVSSRREGNFHFYMKPSEHVKIFINKNPRYAIHDYYMRGKLDPGGPILPRPGNGRYFINIPESVDPFPKELLPPEEEGNEE